MFRSAIKTAAEAAADGARDLRHQTDPSPETGYGYIAGGDRLGTREGCLSVKNFVEKPDLPAAEGYLKNGGYYWNSGMFLFSAGAFLA